MLVKSLIVFLFSACFISGCAEKSTYRPLEEEVDSLASVIIRAEEQLLKTDTAQLTVIMNQQAAYHQFIEDFFEDTLTTVEANDLQRFGSSGEQLKVCSYNRQVLLYRSALLRRQLMALLDDVRARKRTPDEFKVHLTSEKNSCTEFLAAYTSLQATLEQAKLDYQLSFPAVQKVLRKYNYRVPQNLAQNTH